MSTIFFVALNGCAGFLAYSLAREVFSRDPLARLLVSLGLFPCLILLASILAGMLGVLDRAGMSLIMFGGMGVVFLKSRFSGQARFTSESNKQPVESWLHHEPSVLGITAAAISTVPLLVRGLFGHTSFVWDDLWYHATAVGHWFVNGTLSMSPADYHAYFPKNAEVISLWFLIPFGHDSHVGLTPLFWAILTAVALIVISRSTAASIEPGLFAVALVFVSPEVTNQIRSFSSPDLAGAAFILAATAVVILAMTSTEIRIWKSILVAGLFAGFALGCKVSLAPSVLILAGFSTIGLAAPARGRIGYSISFLTGLTITGSYWYLRSWWVSGNPLFPAQVGPFDGPFHKANQASTTLVSMFGESSGNPSKIRELAHALVDWPPALAVLACAGFGLAAVRLTRGENNQVGKALAVLMMIGVVATILHPITPFSGATDEEITRLPPLRFLILPFFVGVSLLAACYPKDRGTRSLWIGSAIAGIAVSWRGTDLDGLAALIGVLVLGTITIHWKGKDQSLAPVPTSVRIIGLVLMLVLVGLLEPLKQKRTQEYLFERTYWSAGSGWRELDALPGGSRIAWFGSEGRRYYPVFGRKFQHEPVPVLGDGTPYRPVHERWPRGEYAWWPPEKRWGWEENIGQAELLENLIESKVDYVFVSRLPNRSWPAQRDLLLAAPEVDLIFKSEKSLLLGLPRDHDE